MKINEQNQKNEVTDFIQKLDQLLSRNQLSDEEIRVLNKAKEYLYEGGYPIEILHKLALTLEHMKRDNILSQPLIDFQNQLSNLSNKWFNTGLTPFIFQVSPL